MLPGRSVFPHQATLPPSCPAVAWTLRRPIGLAGTVAQESCALSTSRCGRHARSLQRATARQQSRSPPEENRCIVTPQENQFRFF
ncbi:hypothetical protein GUJ93_ZPchr0012g22235 [Zizania palustris]|uniref:Uncharacterized protein n=1 Tax=Zizania palustris TaxID=103762 RepID=A0A8J5WPQ4_ZIZPA|nr:hypothetical protein GUJ93_ZPchr0012g22235 [Zizania palustris]